jgi:hypothetical protein
MSTEASCYLPGREFREVDMGTEERARNNFPGPEQAWGGWDVPARRDSTPRFEPTGASRTQPQPPVVIRWNAGADWVATDEL